jgi:hypothetical protein
MAVYVYRNSQERSCNNCCSGKALSTTYAKCVSVPLVTQHVMRMRHIVICGLFGSAEFFHLISKTARFKKSY